MFKAACILVLGLTLPLMPCAQSAVAGQPHLVFTKRIASTNSPELFTYTVQKGDHLYAILRSFHLPEQKLGQWVRKVSELNPHIHDPDILHPGTQISLPRSLKSNLDEQSVRAEQRQDPGPVQSTPHAVTAPVPASPCLNRSVPQSKSFQLKTSGRLFDSVNHQAGNASRLAPEPVFFPARPIKEKQRNARTQTSAQATNISKTSTSTPAATNKDKVMYQLRRLGFRFSRQGEVIYPQGQGKWIRINLDQMPLASSPWKSRILFAPHALLDTSQIKALSQSGLQVCLVPSDWSPRDVFAALERTCRSDFMAWPPGIPLIMPLPKGHRIEIEAPAILTQKEDQKRKIAVFAQPDICSGSIPGLLVGYLQQQGIQIFCFNPESGFSAWKDQHVPSGHNLYTPSLSWPEFKRSVEKSGQALPASVSPQSVLQHLTEQGLLQRYPLHLSWSTPSGLNIILRVSLLGRRNTNGTTYFLPGDQIDPYLVALLNLMGYTTYTLRF